MPPFIAAPTGLRRLFTGSAAQFHIPGKKLSKSHASHKALQGIPLFMPDSALFSVQTNEIIPRGRPIV